MTITRYRKGQLSVPRLYCNNLDTLSGDLLFNRAGVWRGGLYAGYYSFNTHLRLGNNIELLDGGDNAIIASDNSGHIDQLGRVDCNIQHPSGDMQSSSPASGRLISGGAIQNNGVVRSVGAETLRFVLSDAYLSQRYGANPKTQTLTIYYYTSNNGAYITATRIEAYTNELSNFQLLNDTDDYGNGSTGYGSIVATALDDGLASSQILEIDTVIGAGYVEIIYWILTYSDS